MSIPILTLRDRLAHDPLCEIARLEAEETGIPGPFAAWLALFEGDDPAQAMTHPLGRRLTACSLTAALRRIEPGEEPRAYLDAILPGFDALVRALVLPMPEPIHDLGSILGDPLLSDRDRTDAVLARDQSAGWTSHALAYGPHPRDTNRFCVVPEPAPVPHEFGVYDRIAGASVLTRPLFTDAATLAAILETFPDHGTELSDLRAAIEAHRQAGDLDAAESERIQWQRQWRRLMDDHARRCQSEGLPNPLQTGPGLKVA